MKVRIEIDTADFESLPIPVDTGSDDGCPVATKDSKINEDNKALAVEEFGYKETDDTETELCANCASFNQTEQILSCIGDTSGDLGYCQIHKFVCEAKKRCDSWARGGPITDETLTNNGDLL